MKRVMSDVLPTARHGKQLDYVSAYNGLRRTALLAKEDELELAKGVANVAAGCRRCRHD